MDNLENSGIARRTFVRRLALASGGLGLAGAGACAQAETGAAAEASAGEIAATGPPAFELYHEEHGEGPAVVFAHGAGGTHMSWWNQIPTFSQHYRCITYSQRGFGFSPDVAGGPVIPPTLVKGMAAKMPGSTLVTFDDSGHSPYWEIRDRFNAVVLDFLRG